MIYHSLSLLFIIHRCAWCNLRIRSILCHYWLQGIRGSCTNVLTTRLLENQNSLIDLNCFNWNFFFRRIKNKNVNWKSLVIERPKGSWRGRGGDTSPIATTSNSHRGVIPYHAILVKLVKAHEQILRNRDKFLSLCCIRFFRWLEITYSSFPLLHSLLPLVPFELPELQSPL